MAGTHHDRDLWGVVRWGVLPSACSLTLLQALYVWLQRDPWVGGSFLAAPWTTVPPESRMDGLEVDLQACWLIEAHTACLDKIPEIPRETSCVLLGRTVRTAAPWFWGRRKSVRVALYLV